MDGDNNGELKKKELPNSEKPLLEKNKKHEIPSDQLYNNEEFMPTTITDADGEIIHIEYEGEGEELERAAWGGKLEFILTCIGFAVGLGNVWRFPYLCYKNGGGAFLIPYVIMLGIVGLPLFFMEFAFGQFASLGPISAWTISPLFKGVGYGMVIISWLLSLYYNVIVSHCFFYLISSFTSKLPWETCDNWWNNQTTCFVSNNESSMVNGTIVIPPGSSAPSEEYYERYVLEMSSGIDEMGLPSWKLTLCLLLAWVICLAVLLKGIASLGKVAYFTAIFPYFMLTILLLRTIFLPGSLKGVLFYLTPQFDRLLDYRVWTDAATQIFFSLSVGNGGLIAMSSYNKFKNNCCRDAVLVACMNCGTSIYAGFVIFSTLGFMAHTKQVEVGEVAKGGPGLAFIVYPEALSNMPIAPLWAVFFFIMMVTLGFGSQFSIVETVLSGLQDELRRVKAVTTHTHIVIFRVCVCTVSFLLGIPMLCPGGIYLLNLIDVTLSGFPLLFIALTELIVVVYLYGIKQFEKDIQLMINSKPNWYWRITWAGISPGVTLILLIIFFAMRKDPTMDDYTYPNWAIHLGNAIAVFPVIFIPIVFLFRYCRDGGWILFREYLKPKVSWGPANTDHRQEFIDTIRERALKKGGSSAIQMDGGDIPEDPAENFFQSKMSVASKLSRAASKESNMNKISGSVSNFPMSQVVRAEALALAASQSELAGMKTDRGRCDSDHVAASSPNISKPGIPGFYVGSNK